MPVVLIAVAYLLGTFPSATLIARANGIDISTVGSGNPGASNVTRALGWRKGIWVYVLDALKGAIATAIPLVIDGRPLAYWCGAAAIVGHMFPVFRKFRGGKGVATGSGVLLVLHPTHRPVRRRPVVARLPADRQGSGRITRCDCARPDRTRPARATCVGVRGRRCAQRPDPRKALAELRPDPPARGTCVEQHPLTGTVHPPMSADVCRWRRIRRRCPRPVTIGR